MPTQQTPSIDPLFCFESLALEIAAFASEIADDPMEATEYGKRQTGYLTGVRVFRLQALQGRQESRLLKKLSKACNRLETSCDALLLWTAQNRKAPKLSAQAAARREALAWETLDPLLTEFRAAVESLQRLRLDAGDIKTVEQPRASKNRSGSIHQGKPKTNVNARMLAHMDKDHTCRGWTITKWMHHLKCARSSVAETKTWKALSDHRNELKIKRQADRRHNKRSLQIK